MKKSRDRALERGFSFVLIVMVCFTFSTLCDPYLNIFRGIIPPLGGSLDLSPILAFLVLNAFTSSAAALPAELPADLPVPNSSLANPTPLKGSVDLTTSQQKWMRRLQGSGKNNDDGAR